MTDGLTGGMGGVATPASLAELTTLRIGGPAADVQVVETTADFIAAVADADARGCEVLVVGGGSNMVVGDDPLPQRVVVNRVTGVVVEGQGEYDVNLLVQGGHDWDAFVAYAVDHGLGGIEGMSGIPGTVGATVIQNVGAYGQDVSAVVTEIEVYDRHERAATVITGSDAHFAYRHSRFKADPGRYLITAVRFRLRRDARGVINYDQLAGKLGVTVGDCAPLADIRAAVLALRSSKGMVLDNGDHDTWSVGSFFTNPIVPQDLVPEGAPAWPATEGLVKTSAAWLIERAGFARGHGMPGPAAISTKHTLALTNRGSATARDVLELAAEVHEGVYRTFGIRLEPEPNLINCQIAYRV